MIRAKLLPLAAALLCGVGLGACRDGATSSDHVPDIPVYPGAQLIDRVDDEDLDPTDVYAIEGKQAKEVLDWYRDRMADWGWFPVTSEADDVILYNDSEGCYSFVAATQENGSVMLQLSQQRPGSPCIKTGPVETATD